MKLRAITLAAAGLLAAASAQAELQTWRYSGLIMHTVGTVSPEATLGKYAYFDLTFDLDALVTEGTFAAPLVSASVNGTPQSVGSNSLAQLEPWFVTLTTDLDSSGPQALNQLHFKGPADSGSQHPNVGAFLTTTDFYIDEFLSLFTSDGATLEELVKLDIVADSMPTIRVAHRGAGDEIYALIGAHNITPGVPEPSAWALALLGGVGAAAVARRRQPARQAEAQAA